MEDALRHSCCLFGGQREEEDVAGGEFGHDAYVAHAVLADDVHVEEVDSESLLDAWFAPDDLSDVGRVARLALLAD